MSLNRAQKLNSTLVGAIQRRINKWRLRGELSCTSVADILGFISLRHLCREQVHWLLRASQKDSRGPQPQKNAAGKLQERPRCDHNGRIAAEIHLVIRAVARAVFSTPLWF